MRILKSKRGIGLLLAVALILVFALLPGSENAITHTGMCAVGLFLAAIVLWITEVFPMAVTACLIVVLYPLFGVMTFNEAVSSFSTSAVIFVFGTFGITAMIKKTTIPLRLTSFAVRVTKGNPKLLVVMFCLLSGLLSGIMSSTATCALFFSVALVIVEVTSGGKKSGLATALAVGLPVATGVGGFCTPAGTPGNILMMDLLAGFGYEITFAQWTIVGLPMSLIAILIFSAVCVNVFKMEKIGPEEQAKIRQMTQECGTWTRKDITAVCIVALMLGLWLLGSAVPYFNTATVAILGLALMFMPGLDMICWDDFKGECNANIMLMIGFSTVIASSLVSTGALTYLVNTVFSSSVFTGMNGAVLFVVLSGIFCVVASFIPSPAASISLLGPLAFSIAALAGVNPVAVLMAVAFWSAGKMLLLYTEPMFFFTFHAGFYTQKDLLKAGWLPALILSGASLIIIPLVGLIGF